MFFIIFLSLQYNQPKSVRLPDKKKLGTNYDQFGRSHQNDESLFKLYCGCQSMSNLSFQAKLTLTKNTNLSSQWKTTET